MSERACGWGGCEGAYYSKGYCFKHYLKNRRKKPPKVNMVKADVRCYVSLCERKVQSVGLCHSHYTQKNTGKPFTEIRRRVLAHRDESGRVCTECMTYKAWNNFYRASDKKSYKAKCKECTIKLNTIWNRKRTHR